VDQVSDDTGIRFADDESDAGTCFEAEPSGMPWCYVLRGKPYNRATRARRGADEAQSGPFAKFAVRAMSVILLMTCRCWFRITVAGDFPAAGCVAVSGHDSYWDGLIVSALDPRIVPVASHKIRDNTGAAGRFLGPLLTGYGVLWTGEGTVANARSRVAASAVCWLAPRGFQEPGAKRLHQSAERVHLGPARIALESDCPVVPISIIGLDRWRPRPWRTRVRVLIGEPLQPRGLETPEAFTARFLECLAETCSRHRLRVTQRKA
jgi:1-acyl-sn-glycerol-3-phosphate acyltransferase